MRLVFEQAVDGGGHLVGFRGVRGHHDVAHGSARGRNGDDRTGACLRVEEQSFRVEMLTDVRERQSVLDVERIVASRHALVTVAEVFADGERMHGCCVPEVGFDGEQFSVRPNPVDIEVPAAPEGTCVTRVLHRPVVHESDGGIVQP